LFIDAFDKLLSAVEKKREAVLDIDLNRLTHLPSDLNASVWASLKDWQVNGVRKLWAQDATLWTGTDENRWLGWLGITEDQLAHIDHLKKLAQEIKSADHVTAAGNGRLAFARK